jgi:hypothetical protein
MSTLRVSNIEAKADASSPTIDEKVKVTSSQGRVLVQIDGKTAGITSIGINTTSTSFTIDGNNNVQFVGIITAANVNTTGVSTFTNLVVSAGSTSAPSISPSGDSNTGIFFPSADTLAFSEGGVERARIDSAGRVLVGTAPTNRFVSLYTNNTLSSNAGIEIFRAVPNSNPLNAGLVITVNPANNNGQSGLVLAKTNGNANGSFTAVQPGTLGSVVFAGADGSSLRPAAQITGVGGTPNSGISPGSLPGQLTFSTTDVGGTTPTERMRITSAGNLGIGEIDPAYTLDVNGTTNATTYRKAGVAGKLLVKSQYITTGTNYTTTGFTNVVLSNNTNYVPASADSDVWVTITAYLNVSQSGGDNDAKGTVYAYNFQSNGTTQISEIGLSDGVVDAEFGYINSEINSSVRHCVTIQGQCARASDGDVYVRLWGSLESDGTSSYAASLIMQVADFVFMEYL